MASKATQSSIARWSPRKDANPSRASRRMVGTDPTLQPKRLELELEPPDYQGHVLKRINHGDDSIGLLQRSQSPTKTRVGEWYTTAMSAEGRTMPKLVGAREHVSSPGRVFGVAVDSSTIEKATSP